MALGLLCIKEFRAKLELDVRLDFSELMAGDLTGKARAFQSLVNGGMGVEEAARLSGLIVEN